MAGLALTDMKPSRVVGVGAAERFGQRVLLFGDGDQVDMICHERVAQQPQSVAGRVFLKQGEVELAVGIVMEDILPLVASWRDVMRDAHGHRARHSCHLRRESREGGIFLLELGKG